MGDWKMQFFHGLHKSLLSENTKTWKLYGAGTVPKTELFQAKSK